MAYLNRDVISYSTRYKVLMLPLWPHMTLCVLLQKYSGSWNTSVWSDFDCLIGDSVMLTV